MLELKIQTDPIVLQAQGEALVAMAKGIEAERKAHEADAPTCKCTVDIRFLDVVHAIHMITPVGLYAAEAKLINDLKNAVERFETTEVTIPAGDMSHDVVTARANDQAAADAIGLLTPAPVVISTAAEAVEAFGEGSEVARIAAGGTEDAPPPPPADEEIPPPPPATVTLDAAGLPFDARIHGSGRTFYASGANRGNWKTKRSVDPALVASVEEELRAALAVPSPTAEQVEAQPTGITTFAELLTAITGAGLAPAAVTEAVVKVGLEGLPILATRPDLIPTVAAELGL